MFLFEITVRASYFSGFCKGSSRPSYDRVRSIANTSPPATELWRIDGHFYTKVIGMNPQHQVNGEEHLVAVCFTLVLK